MPTQTKKSQPSRLEIVSGLIEQGYAYEIVDAQILNQDGPATAE